MVMLAELVLRNAVQEQSRELYVGICIYIEVDMCLV